MQFESYARTSEFNVEPRRVVSRQLPGTTGEVVYIMADRWQLDGKINGRKRKGV